MKRAIVFGASGGIGQAICRSLAEDGWSLYLHFNHHQEIIDEMVEQLMTKYPQQDFMSAKLDFLASSQKIKEFINSLLPVNAAVFAHGITKYGFLGGQDLTEIEKIIQVNLTAPIQITNLLESTLTKQDFGRIVYLGSVYGGQGSALESTYSATKAALSRFCQAYAREVASTNLTVNVVAPGAVDTAMNKMLSSQELAEVKQEIPMGRFAEGEDISYWVKNILDPRSAYLTGQTIYISGGWLL